MIRGLIRFKVAKSSGSTVEWVEEESFFFKLSEWEKPLLDFYEKNKNFILPESIRNEVISFVKSGLKDLSVSRKTFSWGVKVPSDENHVVYVWLDALTCYTNGINYLNENEIFYSYFFLSLDYTYSFVFLQFCNFFLSSIFFL